MLVAMPWSDEAQVIEWANDTHYGLAAFVFCKDIDRALRAAHRIEAGWVQVNRSGGQLPGMSYGGKKLSGPVGVLDRRSGGELHSTQGHHDRHRMSRHADISVPWASEAVRERVQQIQAGSEPGTAEDLERARAARAHIEAMDANGLVLYAGTNAMTGAVAGHDVARVRRASGTRGEGPAGTGPS